MTGLVDLQARTCLMEGCGRGGKLTRGMCLRCYKAWLDRTPHDQRPVPPRFAAQFDNFIVKRHENGCWTWTGTRDRQGYGRWKRWLAHRFSWARSNGPIPEGLWVLHHCDNPPCVNPAHLYLGTVVENVHDAVDRGRHFRPAPWTHCSEGHELADANLYVWTSSAGQRQRQCRKCNSIKSAARQRAKCRARGLKKTKVSAEEKELILSLRSSGVAHRKIARQLGRSLGAVQRVLAA